MTPAPAPTSHFAPAQHGTRPYAPHGTVRNVRRQCARPGCSALATATFTFDAREKTVWLDLPREGAARAGELCERHVRGLTPPKGWVLEDRRIQPEPEPVPTLQDRVADTPLADVQRLLAAQTPLLARAFEASGNV